MDVSPVWSGAPRMVSEGQRDPGFVPAQFFGHFLPGNIQLIRDPNSRSAQGCYWKVPMAEGRKFSPYQWMKLFLKPYPGKKAISAIVLYDRRLSMLLWPPERQSFLPGQLCCPVRVRDAENWLARPTEESLFCPIKCRSTAVRKKLYRHCRLQSLLRSADGCWGLSDPRPRHPPEQEYSLVWRCAQYSPGKAVPCFPP